MARLPKPGGDDNQWGDILNDFLRISHAPDGSLKQNSVTVSHIRNDSVTIAKLSAELRQQIEAAGGASTDQDGSDGREVQFNTSPTHIQWRYTTDPTWTDLTALSDLTGPQGEKGEPGIDGADSGATDPQIAELIGDRLTDTGAAVDSSVTRFVSETQGIEVPEGDLSLASLQGAIDRATSLNRSVTASGTLNTSGTLRVTCNVDLSGLTLIHEGPGTALRVGSTEGFQSRLPSVMLPHVRKFESLGTNWDGVAGSVGVVISNLYTGTVHVPEVRNFAEGLRVEGLGNGVSYVSINLGHLFNNKVNMRFTSDATGWTNQNNIWGGRMSHNSEMETTGTRHIQIDRTASPVNNNTFWGTSIESPNITEYHLDCGGYDNYFNNVRWENTGTGARVVWRQSSYGNIIDAGYGSHLISETFESGASGNHIRSRGHTRIVGGPQSGQSLVSLENSVSHTRSSLRVSSPGQYASTDGEGWIVDLRGTGLHGKRASDAEARAILDFHQGSISFGNGSAVPSKGFGVSGNLHSFTGAEPVIRSGPIPTPVSYLPVVVGGAVRYIPLIDSPPAE